MTLEADVHEPEEFLKLVSPVIPCTREILNEKQWADYRFQIASGSWVNIERKTWGELLASIDAVEDQLRRHLANQPKARLLFILEGMIEVDSGGTYILKESKRSGVWVRSWRSGTRISRVYSWLYSISQYLEVFQTPNYAMTCQFLIQAYNHGQKAETEHTTFNRYFKKVMFHPNPQVVQLMGLTPNLGEKRAEALIDKFTTVYRVITASPEELLEVPGIGKGLAHTILQRIGRPDV